ncbi:hypothetical protein CEXT_569181 [Caerostris extrusa]|uniref:Uncharacterized protein n=1 Tax=Caerostris extrusa TaxID=172846 RepID=A0AAV4TV76_CAEEX|nr:hypothetical protein CEXT_569181 [Caerostris extrusa]
MAFREVLACFERAIKTTVTASICVFTFFSLFFYMTYCAVRETVKRIASCYLVFWFIEMWYYFRNSYTFPELTEFKKTYVEDSPEVRAEKIREMHENFFDEHSRTRENKADEDYKKDFRKTA